MLHRMKFSLALMAVRSKSDPIYHNDLVQVCIFGIPRTARLSSRLRAGLGHKKNLGLSTNESEDVDFGEGGMESQQSNVVLKQGRMSQDSVKCWDDWRGHNH